MVVNLPILKQIVLFIHLIVANGLCMISSVLINNKFIKMDLDKILNLALNKALIGKDRIKQINSNEIADFVNKHLKAINYIPCCTELNGEEKITFSKWLESNKYEYIHKNLYKQEGSSLLTHVDLLGRQYIKYLNL